MKRRALLKLLISSAASLPLLRIKRTSDKDTQLIEVSEGRLFLEAREEE